MNAAVDNPQCPDQETLESFLSGAVDDSQFDTVSNHVTACDTCVGTLEQLQEDTDFALAKMLQDLGGLSELAEELDEAQSRVESSLRIDVSEDTNNQSSPDNSTREWERASESAPTAESQEPERIGKYLALGEIDKGSFGKVYKAKDPDHHRFVALKVPRPDKFHTEKEIQEFLDESRLLAELDHPNIVGFYDFVRDDKYQCFVVMEYVDGESLKEMLSRGPLEQSRAVDYAIQIAEALHYAHTRKEQFVHRDLKPANVLINSEGQVKLADFGLAMREPDRLDHDGQRAGTLPYMSPEQVRGKADGFDYRIDIWALGVLLYQMLSGELPFKGDTNELMRAIQHSEPRSLQMIDSSIPKELNDVCFRCFEKRPAERFESAELIADTLKAWTRAQAPPWKLWLAGAAGILVVATVVFFSIPDRSPPSPNDTNGANAKGDGETANAVEAPQDPSAGSVRALLWPDNEDSEIVTRKHSVSIKCKEDIGFVILGRTEQDAFFLEYEISQSPLTAFDLVLGHTDEGNHHLFAYTNKSGRHTLAHHTGRNEQGGHKYLGSAVIANPPAGDDVQLRFFVKDGRLNSVSLGQHRIPLDSSIDMDLRGGFGIRVIAKSLDVRKVSVNGVPLRFDNYP